MTRILRTTLAVSATVMAATTALGIGFPGQGVAVAAMAQDGPYAYCWTRRDTGTPGGNTYYFSRVFAMGRDGPTVGFQPSFQSFVSANYTSAGRSSSATCTRFFGRRATEDNMNNRISSFRNGGARIVRTNWAA